MSRRAAFLDRDGTLNVRPPLHEYVVSADDFAWLPGAAEGAALLARAGYVLAVVSNQRGVARGKLTEEVLRQVEARIQRELEAHGCRVEAFRYCPHELADACECRKPKPGMLVELARTLELDLAQSWMIGDSPSDVAAGAAAGCRTALIGESGGMPQPELVAGSLLEASRAIAVRS